MPPLKPTLKVLLSLAIMTSSLGLVSCASNQELEERLEQRSDNYSNLQDRRGMRADARDERYNAWYDRVMR